MTCSGRRRPSERRTGSGCAADWPLQARPVHRDPVAVFLRDPSRESGLGASTLL